MKAVEIASIPAGENPFYHDSMACGMDLKNATTIEKLEHVFVMSAGLSSSYDFYLVNQTDGTRLGIKL